MAHCPGVHAGGETQSTKIWYGDRVSHRVVEIAWMPRTPAEWASFTAARLAAASLWSRMVRIHARIRRARWKWPTKAAWERWAKGRFPALSAQSVQQVVADFCDALNATTKARKAGVVTAKYPWKTKTRYRDVPYTNQTATIRNGVLRLPHGRGGNAELRIRLPRALPGRLVEVTLAYGVVRLVCEVPERAAVPLGPLVGVDMGVNTLVAATDGETAVLVSGRGAKAIVQYRNKSNAELRSRIDRCQRGSKRRKRLVCARYRMSERCARKLKDTLHKTTRAVANAFPNSPVVVGKPFNDAARKMGRVQAQQVSSASNARLIAQLAYKMAGAREVPEPYSSQTCPGCGCRSKQRRWYKCAHCGWSAPRDVVGNTNIRSIGLYGEMRTGLPVQSRIVFVRPLLKYPVAPSCAAGSSGGTPARGREAACSS